MTIIDTTNIAPCRHYSGTDPGCCLPGRRAPRDCVCASYDEDLVAVLSLATEERTRCEVWTRVMGYHRPVAAFNAGKQSEHAERKHFREHSE